VLAVLTAIPTLILADAAASNAGKLLETGDVWRIMLVVAASAEAGLYFLFGRLILRGRGNRYALAFLSAMPGFILGLFAGGLSGWLFCWVCDAFHYCPIRGTGLGEVDLSGSAIIYFFAAASGAMGLIFGTGIGQRGPQAQ
jgi:hypothetical protein